MSGLSRTPGKRVWANPHRGFESRPLRHECKKALDFQGLFCWLGAVSNILPHKDKPTRAGWRWSPGTPPT